MAGFCVAFDKVDHCTPLGYGGIAFRDLHALLGTFKVSISIVQKLSYR
jgi:hypothetical protein